MESKLHFLDPKIRCNLLLSSFVFALFVLIIFNIFASIITITSIMELWDLNNFTTKYANGYFTINQQKIGFPFGINFLLFFIVWFTVFQYTKRSIFRNV